jgi:hypothetical protein
METYYKLMRTDLAILYRCVRTASLTLKLAKAVARIYEVPISYNGRRYAEGKKIN